MGFSWSSAVAQDCTLETCLDAGLQEGSILCPDQPLPAEHSELAMVATDDVIMMHADRQAASARCDHLDLAMEQNGIKQNHEKDITGVDSLVGLGCQLTRQPPWAEPEDVKLILLYRTILDVLSNPFASPRAVHGALGLAQWLCLLARGSFSVFDRIYKFTRRSNPNEKQCIPSKVACELLTFLLLLPLVFADMGRTHAPLVLATDAAPEFGFGVSVHRCSSKLAATIGRLAEKRGDFVKLTLNDDEPTPKDRIGEPHSIALCKDDFTTAISSSRRWPGHPGALEAHGVLLGVRWCTRQPCLHDTRIPILVDAKAILSAATKGRSSAGSIRGSLRSIAALLLASNILARYVYVPTEYNPADPPSRGRRVRTLAHLRTKKLFAKKGREVSEGKREFYRWCALHAEAQKR